MTLSTKVLNGLMMAAIRLRIPVPPYSRRNVLIVETIGRRSGRRYRNPAGCIEEDGKLIVVAERGANAHWVRNALAQEGRLRVYFDGRCRPAQLRLLEGDPEDYLNRMNRRHAAAVRRYATTPQAVEITLG